MQPARALNVWVSYPALTLQKGNHHHPSSLGTACPAIRVTLSVVEVKVAWAVSKTCIIGAVVGLHQQWTTPEIPRLIGHTTGSIAHSTAHFRANRGPQTLRRLRSIGVGIDVKSQSTKTQMQLQLSIPAAGFPKVFDKADLKPHQVPLPCKGRNPRREDGDCPPGAAQALSVHTSTFRQIGVSMLPH